MAMPLKDAEKLNSTGGQRVLTLSEPHRVRVVKLKAYKSIQVIRRHSYREKRESGGKAQLEPGTQASGRICGQHPSVRRPWVPGGAGRFIPLTMIRCISVLLSSEKILQTRIKRVQSKKTVAEQGPAQRSRARTAGSPWSLTPAPSHFYGTAVLSSFLKAAPLPPPHPPWHWEVSLKTPESPCSAPNLLPYPCTEPQFPLGFGTSQSGRSSTQSGGWEGQGPGPELAAVSQAVSFGPEQASQTCQGQVTKSAR